jgi:hypothetical protein
MQMHVDIYLSNDDTHVPWRIRLTLIHRGGQIIRLPTTENLPTATEPTSTAYRLPKKKKFEIRN